VERPRAYPTIPATVRAAARRLVLAESSHRGRDGVIAFAVRTAGAARVLSPTNPIASTALLRTMPMAT